jgi:hypothetical protein
VHLDVPERRTAQFVLDPLRERVPGLLEREEKTMLGLVSLCGLGVLAWSNTGSVQYGNDPADPAADEYTEPEESAGR